MKKNPSELLLHYKDRFGNYSRIKAGKEYLLDLVMRDENAGNYLIRERVMNELEKDIITAKDLVYKYACAYYIEAYGNEDPKMKLGYCAELDRVEVFSDESK